MLCFLQISSLSKELNADIPPSKVPVMLKKVLVLGGNGMLGGEAVYKMIQLGLDVTILNRGTWYWDSAERIKPHVGHIRCNRAGNLAESCHELAENKVFYDVVVDFSSYYPEDLQVSRCFSYVFFFESASYILMQLRY